MGLFLCLSQSQLPNTLMEQQLQSVSSATMLGAYRTHLVTTSLQGCSVSWAAKPEMSFTLHHQSITAKFTSDLWHQTSTKLTLCYQNAACHAQSPPATINTWHEHRYHEIYLFVHVVSSTLSSASMTQTTREGDLFRTEEKTTFQSDLLKHLHFQVCRNFSMTWRTFGWNFAQVCTYPQHSPWTCTPQDFEQLGMLHHTRVAVYSCSVLVSTMSSPTESSGTISTGRNYLTWVKTLQREVVQWNLTSVPL